jgi:hypothetical protein
MPYSGMRMCANMRQYLPSSEAITYDPRSATREVKPPATGRSEARAQDQSGAWRYRVPPPNSERRTRYDATDDSPDVSETRAIIPRPTPTPAPTTHAALQECDDTTHLQADTNTRHECGDTRIAMSIAMI